jgi:hypothetical protein
LKQSATFLKHVGDVAQAPSPTASTARPVAGLHFQERVMDLVSAAYNKLEGLAVAADRVLNAAVACCETWLAGRRPGEGPDRAAASHKNRRLSP